MYNSRKYIVSIFIHVFLNILIRFIESKAIGTEMNFTLKNTNICVK